MPLFIDGQPYQPHLSISDFIDAFPRFRGEAEAFCQKQMRHCAPPDLLYVNQREYAVTIPADDVVRVLGSDDATTCHIAVVRHSGSEATGLTHLDGHGMEEGIPALLTRLEALSEGASTGRFELHLFGGFCDERGESSKISKEVLTIFHNGPQDVHLVTACFTDLNDDMKNGIHWPILYGVAVDVRSGEIFPASFEDKGPDPALRTVYTLFGETRMRNVYEHTTGVHMISSFSYEVFSHTAFLLQQPDEFIREHMSTSPAVEPPYFEQHIRDALQWLLDCPAHAAFKGGRPREYSRDREGRWVAKETTSCTTSSSSSS